MERSISISEAAENLAGIMDEISGTRERVVITREGVPAAVMMSLDAYESLVETIEILADPEMMAALREAEEEKRAGKFLAEEEFWREVS